MWCPSFALALCSTLIWCPSFALPLCGAIVCGALERCACAARLYSVFHLHCPCAVPLGGALMRRSSVYSLVKFPWALPLSITLVQRPPCAVPSIRSALHVQCHPCAVPSMECPLCAVPSLNSALLMRCLCRLHLCGALVQCHPCLMLFSRNRRGQHLRFLLVQLVPAVFFSRLIAKGRSTIYPPSVLVRIPN